MSFHFPYQQALTQLKAQKQFRSIPSLIHQGQFVSVNDSGISLINIASNDYLGIGADSELQDEFLDYVYHLPKEQRPRFGSTSSRLLTGNNVQLELLEQELEDWYGSEKSALMFNSGYHSNLGILPALASLKQSSFTHSSFKQSNQSGTTLILADKLVHASIIDGMRLAHVNNKVPFKRYRHNDHAHLQKLIMKAIESDEQVGRIIIVTESIFSMDGDIADLADLVAIKQAFTSDSLCIELYVDEAHAVGVLGKRGLGLCEMTNTLDDIDYLVGTFGKAFASMGAYLICSPVIKQWLINSMRPLIYSTALPPMTHAWSRFILQKMTGFHDRRIHLANISQVVKHAIEQKTGTINPSQSPIIPYILVDNETTVNKAKALQQAGFYALPIRPPTVPPHTARIRLVMNAGLDMAVCERLIGGL